MEELLHNAKEELKRVDHLIYVSLKYTRTVDVLMNVIKRLINSFDFISESLLKKAFDEKKIKIIPIAPKLKAEELEKLYQEDREIVDAIRLYMLLRRISITEYDKINEYRRHVAMVVNIDKEEILVSIDLVTEYYKQAKKLIEYIETNYLNGGQ